MTLSRMAVFALIGELSRQVLPRLHHAQRLPLRISCIGTAHYDGLGDADGFDRSVIIGECPSGDAVDLCQPALRLRRGTVADVRIEA
ncbi:hypothetical protein [Paracoccus aminovorans]|uniref:hypothetical protein n=1 Tax=Paracoccus aminovorans TaxID=34004 RepID=UPI000A428AA4|nr:hypothetical protein [Paracoccus aminovorans]